VVVLGHEVWRTRFAADRSVLGQNVQLGGRYATVVGVMPEGYAFPVSHEAWTPLRMDELHRAPREGPGITVFGRLAPGASLERAQAELTTLGRRATAEMPRTHEHLQPRVTPYAQLIGGGPGDDQPIFLLINAFAVMLLVLVCGNVAMLLFARAATRESELVVRSALGASRGRIVTQLFAEALVLGGLAATVGLAASTFALDRWGTKFLTINMGKLPFWFDPRLSPSTVLWACLLTLIAAVITGVVPGLKITRGMASRLKVGTAGGGGVRFGGVWTAVIVTQVAFTVFFPSIGLIMRKEFAQVQSSDPGFAAEEFLAVELDTNSPSEVGTGFVADTAADRARFAAAVAALGQRVATEPGVEGVTFVDHLPRDSHRYLWAELDAEPGVAAEAGAAAATRGRWVGTARIDPSYFEVLQVPMLSGRAFNAADLAPGSRTVIVDQGFVDQMMQGRNPIGRRIRLATSRVPDTTTAAAAPLPWHEIVGVVKELGMGTPLSGENMQKQRPLGVYLPAAPGTAGPLNMMVHVRGDPMSLAPTVRAIAARVDPALRLSNLQRVDEVNDSLLWLLRLWMRMTAALTGIAIVLSLAGIYAVLSYTVARRTREIGVRVALGASRGRVVAATFRQPFIQVALGVIAGSALIFAGSMLVMERTFSPLNVVQLVAYAVLMLGVCMLACIVPTRRALGVEPTVALRAE
jgi:predicted permease